MLFSPLSMASSASERQLGDDTMDSSFELDVVEEHTPPRASLKSISERDFNAPEVVTAANAEQDAEHKLAVPASTSTTVETTMTRKSQNNDSRYLGTQIG